MVRTGCLYTVTTIERASLKSIIERKSVFNSEVVRACLGVSSKDAWTLFQSMVLDSHARAFCRYLKRHEIAVLR